MRRLPANPPGLRSGGTGNAARENQWHSVQPARRSLVEPRGGLGTPARPGAGRSGFERATPADGSLWSQPGGGASTTRGAVNGAGGGAWPGNANPGRSGIGARPGGFGTGTTLDRSGVFGGRAGQGSGWGTTDPSRSVGGAAGVGPGSRGFPGSDAAGIGRSGVGGSIYGGAAGPGSGVGSSPGRMYGPSGATSTSPWGTGTTHPRNGTNSRTGR
jgi:hypothetical protein